MFGAIASAVGGLASSFLGGKNKPVASPDESAGIASSLSAEVPPEPAKAKINGSQVGEYVKEKAGEALDQFSESAGSQLASKGLEGIFGPTRSGKKDGQYTRDYMDAAFPQLNQWEQAGAGASGSGSDSGNQDAAIKLEREKLKNAKDIARDTNRTQKEVAEIQSATAIQNTKDQVYAQNEMLEYNKRESTERAIKIFHDANLSQAQRAHELAKITLTELQSKGVVITNDQQRYVTERVKEEITKTRYSGHLGEAARSFMNISADIVDKLLPSDLKNNILEDRKDGITMSGGIQSSVAGGYR